VGESKKEKEAEESKKERKAAMQGVRRSGKGT
jgi:hypothetical protein